MEIGIRNFYQPIRKIDDVRVFALSRLKNIGFENPHKLI